MKHALFAQQLARSRRAGSQHVFEALAIERGRSESRFLCQLAALALLGEALFGRLVRVAFGDSGDAAASRDFRHRLARLLTESR